MRTRTNATFCEYDASTARERHDDRINMENLQIRLKSRPDGEPADGDFSIAVSRAPQPRPGELLLRTIYLIDYLLNPRFRAEVRHALNRGESTHTLQRAIHAGKVPAQLSKRHESLAAVSSALSLLSNAVMAWNASHMQTALERIRQAGGTPLPVDMRRVAPTDIQGINLRGTFDFPIEKFAERIMPSSAQTAAPGRWRSA